VCDVFLAAGGLNVRRENVPIAVFFTKPLCTKLHFVTGHCAAITVVLHVSQNTVASHVSQSKKE
jgi:hypothetical protein